LAEAPLWLDPSVSAPAPPPGAALPGVDGSRPLLGSDAEQGGTPAAGAGVIGLQPPALPLVSTRVRAEGIVRGLTDRLFAAWESGWPYDRSAETGSWLRT
jgi:hypothetical protein